MGGWPAMLRGRTSDRQNTRAHTSARAILLQDFLEPVFEHQLKAGIASTIDNMIAEGDVVVVQLRGKAETKDGRPYNNTYCHVFRMRNGKIGDVTEYFDTELASTVFGR